MVVVIPQGRERYVETLFDYFGEVANWIEQYRQIWEARVDCFGDILEKMKQEKKCPQKTK